MKAGARVFTTVDIERVDIADPEAAIRTFQIEGKPKVVYCDVLIAGGGMGGIAAAIRAAKRGVKVCVTEETSWIGGQMTAQGVSALDENHFVETSGATRLYQKLRTDIRQHYRQREGAAAATQSAELLNPGDCWVSWLSFEPRVALDKLVSLIDQLTPKRSVDIRTRTKVVDVKVKHYRVESLLAVNLDSGKFIEFRTRFCVDATELGDLMPLVGVEYCSGAESRDLTGEPHAPGQANVGNVQDFTYPFVVEYRPGERHVIDKPAKYDDFNKRGKFSFQGYAMFRNAPVAGSANTYLPFWTYRRLISKDKFSPVQFPFDVSMINWDSNDLRGENIIDVDEPTQAHRLANGKLVSLGFLYWLQTEAPRDEGGKGYPELSLRIDVLDTADGLSKYPYIREARRLKAKKTIVEQDIASVDNPSARAKLSDDTVGIGLYPIDIHGHQDVPGAGQAAKPFQIPLAAMVQTRLRNFLPACKNIGTTHVTNGAYRLHPIEWAIGEAAGEVAAFSVLKRTTPASIQANRIKLRNIQHKLIADGAPIFWFDDVPTTHQCFAAVQFVAALGLMPGKSDELHFRPDEVMDALEAEVIVAKVKESAPSGTTSRAEFAQWLYSVVAAKRSVGKF